MECLSKFSYTVSCRANSPLWEDYDKNSVTINRIQDVKVICTSQSVTKKPWIANVITLACVSLAQQSDFASLKWKEGKGCSWQDVSTTLGTCSMLLP